MRAFSKLSGNTGRNSWGIGVARFDIATISLLAPSRRPIISAADIPDEDIAFVADPFRVSEGGATYVLAEVWSRSAERGRIAAFELDTQEHVVRSSIVLSEPFHLSYPCVFKQGDDYYLLPEAWESGQLILYKAHAFPWSWKRHRVLLELDYADPQIFFYNNVWFIFLNTDPLTNASASIFWAESLEGEWRSHPQNPMVDNDALCARSAGSIVRYDGRMFRFSQDCRERYGSDVFVSEITKLSPYIICTRPLGAVALRRPAWALDAFHHIDVFFDNGASRALFDGYTATIEPEFE